MTVMRVSVCNVQRHQVSVRTITKLGHSCDYLCTIVLGGGALANNRDILHSFSVFHFLFVSLVIMFERSGYCYLDTNRRTVLAASFRLCLFACVSTISSATAEIARDANDAKRPFKVTQGHPLLCQSTLHI